MSGDLLQVLQNEGLDIIFPLLMIILVIFRFILWNIIMIFWIFIKHFNLMSKLNIMLLSSALGVIWARNTFNAYRELLVLHIHYMSCTDTSEQNDAAERKHRHIIETTRSLLLFAYVSTKFWGKEILTVVYLINKSPHSTPLVYYHLKIYMDMLLITLP